MYFELQIIGTAVISFTRTCPFLLLSAICSSCRISYFFFFSEIPNFLSEEECDRMIHLAESKQFVTSTARGGLQSISEFDIPNIRSKSLLIPLHDLLAI